MTTPKLKVLVAVLLATVAVGGVILVRAAPPEPAAQQQRGENVNGAATPAGAAAGRADEPPTKSDPKNAEGRIAEPPPGELAWGEMNNGLRLGLQGAQGRLLVTVENVGTDDVMVNLGMMLDNGKKHLPASLWLTVTGAGKKPYTMTYKQPRVAGRVDPFVVPLPAGSRYALVLKLDDFTSPELDGALPAGRYTVTAQFSGDRPIGKTAKGADGPAAFTYWAGSAKSGEVAVTVAAKLAEVKLADVQAKYRKLPVKVLKLKEPIEVKTVAYLKDGGSVVWVLRDADGAEHSFRTYEKSSGPLFYATRPNEKGQELKDGGAEQQELYGLLLRWIDRNVANAPKFLADRAAPEAKVDAAALGLSFRALERRIAEVTEKGTYPE